MSASAAAAAAIGAMPTHTVPDVAPLLPHPKTPWKLSEVLLRALEQTSQEEGKEFKRVQLLPEHPEYEFVRRCFLFSRPPGIGIKKIEVIENPNQVKAFEKTLTNMNSLALRSLPSWKEEDNRGQRTIVCRRWKEMRNLFQPLEHSDGKTSLSKKMAVLPLFQGSSLENTNTVASLGFNYSGRNNSMTESYLKIGNFGRGLYFTDSAEYAVHSSQGEILLAFVSMLPPYPITSDRESLGEVPTDVIKVRGMGSHKGFNTHFSPVSSVNPENPYRMELLPTPPGKIPVLDEFVVFDPSQALLQFRIEIASEMMMIPSKVYTNELCIKACQEGALDQIKTWFREDLSRKQLRTEDRRSLLHYAVEAGQEDVVAFLLTDDTLLNLVDIKGRNAFHLAAARGDVAVGKQLLQKKPNFIDAPTTKGWYPIHFAAASRHLPFMQWLYRIKPEVLEQTSKNRATQNWTAYHFAAFGGGAECMKWLLSFSQEHVHAALCIGAEYGQIGTVKAILEIGYSYIFSMPWVNEPNPLGRYPIHIAAYHSQWAIVELLVEYQASITQPDEQGYLPIHMAARNGAYVIVNILLDLKTPIDVKGYRDRTPLHMAVFKGHHIVVNELLKKGASINAQTSFEDRQKTPLHDAVLNRSLRIVQLLTYSDDLDVNIQDSQGHTPLWWAVHEGFFEMIPPLLQHRSYQRPLEDNLNSIESLLAGRGIPSNAPYKKNPELRKVTQEALRQHS